jgi:hypothetical protein
MSGPIDGASGGRPVGGASGAGKIESANVAVRELFTGRRAMAVLDRCMKLLSNIRDGMQATAIVLSDLQKLPIAMQKKYTDAAAKFVPPVLSSPSSSAEASQAQSSMNSAAAQRMGALADMAKNRIGIWQTIGGGLSQATDTVMTTTKSFVDVFSRFLDMFTSLVGAIVK